MKNYNEALEKAKQLLRTSAAYDRFTIEAIFPELKENNDERVRKAIIEFFELQDDNTTYSFIPKKDIIAWLEKQGSTVKTTGSINWHDASEEPEKNRELLCEWRGSDECTWHDIAFYNPANNAFWNCGRQVKNVIRWCYVDELKQIKQNPITFNDAHIIDSALNDYCCKKYNALHNENGCVLSFARLQHLAMDIYGWCKKQCEQKPINKIEPMFRIGDTLRRKGKDYTFTVDRIQGGYYHCDHDNGAFFPIEEQDEWELVSKAERKFNVGDWGIDETDGMVFQITKVLNNTYTYKTIDGDVYCCAHGPLEDDARLWDITKDAKDGDVIVDWNNTAFIFKAIEDETVKFHIVYNEKFDEIKTPLNKSSHIGLTEPQFEYHPATKEQRDLLFQKMQEAGYEWDADKKELKKIEQYNVWNEAVKKKFNCILQATSKAADDNEDSGILQRFSFYSYKDEPDILYLAGLYVNEEHRNKGIGTKILEVADEVAKHLNCNAIRLKTTKDSNAERLYRAHGYNSLANEENGEIWLEKQSEHDQLKKTEQKSAGDAEPKFKVEKGKWYACTQTFVLRGENVVIKGQIYKSNQNGAIEGENKRLFIDTHDGRASDYFRPWTIQDAKDGDIFASDNGVIILVKESRNSLWGYRLSYHCAVLSDGAFEHREFHVNPEKFFPATKEQRELLFQKMKEAGYEWDAEKKELKKIEQKIWSEEDENRFDEAISMIESNGNWVRSNDAIKLVSDWLKSLKDRVQTQPMQELSEEDKVKINRTVVFLENLNLEYLKVASNDILLKDIEWLKSLRDKCLWKPSEEQMKALADALSLAKNCGEESSFHIRRLYEQLKKIREE